MVPRMSQRRRRFCRLAPRKWVPARSSLRLKLKQFSARWLPRSADLSFTWRDGSAAFRSDAHVGGIAGMAMGGNASPKQEPALPAGAPGDPWERGGEFENDFVAIRKDVRVKMNRYRMGGIEPEKAKALVAAAMSKI